MIGVLTNQIADILHFNDKYRVCAVWMKITKNSKESRKGI